jgi:hypothetical protein
MRQDRATKDYVPDLWEGETLRALWHGALGDWALPYHYGFQMRPDLNR